MQWRLFAEGALRNKVFHDDVIRIAAKPVWLATGISIMTTPPFHPELINTIIAMCGCVLAILLPEGSSDDICRPAQKGEYSPVPDCRQCKTSNPAYYAGCIKKIFPVHHHCHAQIHEREKFWFNTLQQKIVVRFSLCCVVAISE